MNSVDSAARGSVELAKSKIGKKEKNLLDTPEAKEARMALYESRADKKGPNNRFINMFTGEEYNEGDYSQVDPYPEEDEDEE